jgi:serine/threonine-protein kinase
VVTSEDTAVNNANTDRNLLFGILALQMDFIGRDALIKGMHAWALEKAKSLGQILVEQQALAPDRHALLEALVREHVKQHGNDPKKSLAAVGPVGSVGEDLRQIADLDVQASLGHLPAGSPATTDSWATVPPAGDSPASAPDPWKTEAPTSRPPVGARFRILRPYARGGLGQVSVAHDDELHREVALKEIQDQHADHPDARSRFLLEAEVTGGLEHPGIVPVYSLGTYADGRPFYAMRFIRGDSLKEALDHFHATGEDLGMREWLLGLRDLLGRFVDVCNALAYAHARGVLHRDLKPGNIMLGRYGETLVVDWGLAKPLGKSGEHGPISSEHRPEAGGPLQLSAASSSSSTLTGSAVGTPQYMSPEQAAGRLEELGPASDVYSLGATLYSVLTGKSPFTGKSTEEILRQVQRGEFPWPRQVKARVPAALEAICLKAMRLRPEDRYAMAADLSADVERWLADEPVSAYREPLAARAARWARNHRVLVAGAAVLLVTAVIALAVGTAFVWREKERTEEQRRQAEANFQTALRAVDDMLTEVAQEELANEPRMQDKQRALLARAREYYASFLAQKGDDPRLRKETALASERLADVSRLLDRHADAEDAYGKAIALFGLLEEENPHEASYREGTAHCRNFLGEVYRRTGRSDEAAKAYRDALAVQRGLIEEFHGRPEHRLQAARSCYNLGILIKDPRRIDEAEDLFRESITLLSGLVKEAPRKAEYRQHLARASLNRGPLRRAAGRFAQAEQAYREAITLQLALVKEDENTPEYRHELAVTWNNLGNLLRDRHRNTDAVAAHREALERLHRLVLDFPLVPLYQAEQANTLNSLGVTLAQDATDRLPRGVAALVSPVPQAAVPTGAGEFSAAGESWEEAGRRFAEARAAFDRLSHDHADVPAYRAGRGVALGSLGWFALRGGQVEQAQRHLAEAVADLEAATGAEPGNTDYRRLLRQRRLLLVDALLHQGRHAPAAEQAKALARSQGSGVRGQESAEASYLAATVLARCAAAAARDEGLADAQRRAAAERYAEDAMRHLGDAIDNGFADAGRLGSDAALAPLRQRDDFRALLSRMKKKG